MGVVMKIRGLALLFFLCGIAISAPTPRTAVLLSYPDTVPYFAQDLGSLGSFYLGNSSATAINDAGHVVGSATAGGNATHAFFWSSGVMQDLGTMGGISSTATAINANDQVVGQFNLDSTHYHAFRWTSSGGSGGVMLDLGTLPGGTWSTAVAINLNGQVTGTGDTPSRQVHGFLWTPNAAGSGGSMLDLGAVGGGSSHPVAINASGQVAGYIIFPSGTIHAFLSTPSVDLTTSSMLDLGTLGGSYASGVGLTDDGWVAGSSSNSSGLMHAFVYDPSSPSLVDLGTAPGDGESNAAAINRNHQVTGTSSGQIQQAMLWSPGGPMVGLGTLGGRSSFGVAINDQGQIAGYSTLANTESHAFFWSGGAMQDLGSLNGFTGYNLAGGFYSTSVAINASGQVAGYSVAGSSGNSAGQNHAFIWTPGSPTLTDLGTFAAGTQSSAVAISPGGNVTGSGMNPAGFQHAILWSGGQIQDLGVLPGGKISSARAVNDLGQVIGVGSVGPSNDPHGFFWSQGTMTDLGEFNPVALNAVGQVVGTSTTTGHALFWASGMTVPIDLNTLLQTPFITPVAMNDSGVVTGYFSQSFQSRGFVCSPFGVPFQILAPLPGGNFSGPMGIDSNGRVRGTSNDGFGADHAVFWNSGVIEDLGTIIPVNFASSFEVVTVNENGQVIGDYTNGFGSRHLYRWSYGQLTELVLLPGANYGSVTGLNKIGQVVGACNFPSGQSHAFVWSFSSMEDLGTLGGGRSTPYALNDAGNIVGDSLLANGTDTHAVLWQRLITPPAINMPPPQPVFVESPQGGLVNLDARSYTFDPDGGPLTFTWTYNGGQFLGSGPVLSVYLPVGQFTITVTATDAFGSSGQQTIQVFVADNIPPVLSHVPGPITIRPTSPAGVVVDLPPPGATDNFDPSPIVTPSGIPPNNLYPPGTTLVTWTAADQSNNTTSAVTMVNVVTDLWNSGGSMSTAREGHTATVLQDGRVLVAGGIPSAGTATASAELYDPLTNQWQPAGAMNDARSGHTATLLPGGQVLVTGGQTAMGQVLNRAELYDPVANTWTSAGTMATSRFGHGAALLPDGRVLVAGGLTDVGGGNLQSTATCEIFALQAGWSVTGSLALDRTNLTVTPLVTGQVLVTGGLQQSSAQGPTASAELWSPVTNSWSSAPPMSAQRVGHSAAPLADGRVLVAGGIDASAEIFDPGTATWSPAGTLSVGRSDFTLLQVPDGRVLAAGGSGGGTDLATAEFYDLLLGTWSSASPMATPRHSQAGVLLADGRVLVTGGLNNGLSLTSAEIYEPASSGWTGAGTLNTPRFQFASTLLLDGRVLVTGGNGASTIASTELYDSRSNRWTPAASMSIPRSGHVAALLKDGRVLVAGGYSNGIYTQTAEIFDPASKTWTPVASMSVGRYQAGATMLADGRVLVVGGTPDGVSYPNYGEVYNPVQNSWTSTGPMDSGRTQFGSVLLPDSRVLVAGGFVILTDPQHTQVSLSSVELYDPVQNTWQSGAPMTAPRQDHTVSLLPLGRVLVAGGYSNTSGGLSSAELYDSTKNTWSSAGQLASPRYSHVASSISGGRVLIAGGFGTSSNQPVQDAEVYSAESNAWSPISFLYSPRFSHSATLLADGRVLVSGGIGNQGFPARAEVSPRSLLTDGSHVSPAFVNPPATVTLNAKSSQGVDESALTPPTVSDAASPLIQLTNNAPAILPVGTTLVVWTATDLAGNSTSFNMSVTVLDSPPVMTGGPPASITQEAQGPAGAQVFLAWPTASSLAENSIAVIASTNPPVKGLDGMATGGKYQFPLGTTQVTFTATNATAMSVSQTTTVTVIDSTPPQIMLPAEPQTVSATGPNGAPVNLTWPPAFDLVDGSTTVTGQVIQQPPGTPPVLLPPSATGGATVLVQLPLGTTTIDFRSSDQQGNVSHLPISVTVQDTIPPSIQPIPPVTIQTTTPASTFYAFPNWVVTDPVDPNPQVVVTGLPSGDNFPLGTTTITVQATNFANLTMTSSTTVTMIDATQAQATITTGPPAQTQSTSATFQFSSTESGDTFQRSLDNGPWIAVSNPETLSGLSEGSHTYQVEAINLSAIAGQASAPYTWIVDFTPPTGSVADGLTGDQKWQPSLTSISANWSFQALSGIAQLQWAIGTTQGGTDVLAYQSLQATQTSATASSLALTNGSTYYVSVRATSGVGLTTTATSSGITVDTSPPGGGLVYDGPTPGVNLKYQSSLTSISANWTGFADAQSGITGYVWAIGTSSSGTDIQPFTSVGSQTSATATGLTLTQAAKYFVTVKAQDGAGLFSAPKSSAGIIVDSLPPTGGTVRDGTGADIAFQSSATTISANWSGFTDPVSGIAGYAWAIGTSPGGADVQPFTAVGLVTQMTATGLSLVQGKTYFVTVQATSRAGLTNAGVSSNGVLVDALGPIGGPVFDGTVTGVETSTQISTARISANWAPFTAASGIVKLKWGIGTTPGATDVRAFANLTATATAATRSGLALSHGTTYYVTVQATSGSGVVTQFISSGVTVQ
jgi:probable HAF family extracellular repeat protein